MRAAMTGHLVLSTVHTNNAVSSVDRLLDIGVESYLIAGAVQGIVSQRLVRRVCPYCRRPYTPTPEEQAALGLPAGDVRFYRGVGCGECFGTGYPPGDSQAFPGEAGGGHCLLRVPANDGRLPPSGAERCDHR